MMDEIHVVPVVTSHNMTHYIINRTGCNEIIFNCLITIKSSCTAILLLKYLYFNIYLVLKKLNVLLEIDPDQPSSCLP